jgi:hypothetical protein
MKEIGIRSFIRSEEKKIRSKHSWLRHQNMIGIGVLLCSLFLVEFVSFLYIAGSIHWSIVIPLIALATSILHELEHDLIHNLYFKGNKWVQNFMLFTIWVAKASISPWYRKFIHLRHHNHSGSKFDIEERLIGIGEPFGLRRLIASFYAFGPMVYFNQIRKDNPEFNYVLLTLSSLPVVLPFITVFHLFHEYIRWTLGWTMSNDWVNHLPQWCWAIISTLAVCWVLPNILRQTCLNLMATYSHYYDIQARDVFHQNQILDHWSLFGLNLFCFNFGATHIIHHYVTDQPFYIRQMISKSVRAELIKQGVQHNDFDIVRRDNRMGT